MSESSESSYGINPFGEGLFATYVCGNGNHHHHEHDTATLQRGANELVSHLASIGSLIK